MHIPDILGWVKRLDIEIVRISIIGYDLSDTQDGLNCWRMGFTFCGKHPLLLTRFQMSDPGPMVPLNSSPEPKAH